MNRLRTVNAGLNIERWPSRHRSRDGRLQRRRAVTLVRGDRLAGVVHEYELAA
jgi:hypothetical protein